MNACINSCCPQLKMYLTIFCNLAYLLCLVHEKTKVILEAVPDFVKKKPPLYCFVTISR